MSEIRMAKITKEKNQWHWEITHKSYTENCMENNQWYYQREKRKENERKENLEQIASGSVLEYKKIIWNIY